MSLLKKLNADGTTLACYCCMPHFYCALLTSYQNRIQLCSCEIVSGYMLKGFKTFQNHTFFMPYILLSRKPVVDLNYNMRLVL